MAVVSLTFFRFHGRWPKFWAFTQMQLAKGPLARLPGVSFSRTLGTGSGEGFDPYPNFSVYALLVVWTDLRVAERTIAAAPVFERYRRRSAESWSLFLEPCRAKGRWGGALPFEVAPADPAKLESTPLVAGPGRSAEAAGPTSQDGPIAVLTRATIRPLCMPAFWRSVPSVSAATRAHPGLRFKIGLGELPFAQLMTFSLWDDEAAIRRFAYAHGPHRETLQEAHARGWFREDLFARFRLLASVGTWNGVEPLASEVPAAKPRLQVMS